jgi:hypothetical protein
MSPNVFCLLDSYMLKARHSGVFQHIRRQKRMLWTSYQPLVDKGLDG